MARQPTSQTRASRAAGRGRPVAEGRPPRRIGPLGVLARAVALLAVAWLFGFVAFVASLPGPAPLRTRTDAAVVLTGGPGRVARGVAVLRADAAQRLLVSGVARSVKPHELALANDAPLRLFRERVDLGFVAADTRTNAMETAAWIAENDYRSVRLITASYHLPRAAAELRAEVPPGVRVVPDGVPAGLPPMALAREYTKYVVVTAMRRGGFR